MAGIVSSLSPCSIAIIPIIIGFVGGFAGNNIKKSIFYSFSFVFGLAVTFTILGVVASLTGTLLGNIGGFWKYILAAFAIVMGLQLLGILKFQIPTPRMVKTNIKGPLGAFLMGMLFGVASSPCATPILAVILAFVASKQNIVYGTSLLIVYALGNSILILLMGIFTGFTKSIINSKGFTQFSEYSYKIFGVILILAGLLIYVKH